MILRHTKLLGILFLAMLVGGAWLTYAIFTKKFVEYDEVTLQTSRIGLQLPERADVKIRGVIVGEVLDYVPTEAGADITLGLYPEEIGTIPAGVTGSIVPKTLFGEKYVALVMEGETTSSGPTIEAGDVIDRTEVATEVEKVLSDLYPLLRTVQPAELNMTLNALATALEGRGDQLGDNLETLDSYLKRFNPQLPGAIEDLRLTAQVSDIYADVLPEVGQILRDQVTTLGTLEEQSDTLNALFRDVTAFSGSARTFLADNEKNLIRLGRGQRAAGAAAGEVLPGVHLPDPRHRQRRQAAGRGVPQLHPAHRPGDAAQPAACLQRQRQASLRRDTSGPHCLTLPNPPFSQSNPGEPAGLQRRCRRADRKGHLPRRLPDSPPAPDRGTPAASPSSTC